MPRSLMTRYEATELIEAEMKQFYFNLDHDFAEGDIPRLADYLAGTLVDAEVCHE